MAGDVGAGDSSANTFAAGGVELVNEDAGDQSPPIAPIVRRELIAILIWTLLADLLIFRANGFTGPGLFLAFAPVVFLIGCPKLIVGPGSKLCIGLSLVVAARMIWLGSGWNVVSGWVLIVALSMSASGCVPYVMEGFVLACRAVVDGAIRISQYPLPRRIGGSVRSGGRALAWLLPAIAAVVFGAIFVFANPDLVDLVSIRIRQLTERIELWLEGLSIWELPFCLLALLIGCGLMRPVLPLFQIGPVEAELLTSSKRVPSPLYAAYRNTLLTLIVLFAVYLTFEWITLWKRDFPSGFYYAGYAHQGAAWLTVALALATAVLSAIFSGTMLRDDRLEFLRRLSWIWSAQNLLLAAAVYNRLQIYIGYNGMTRLRTVGFFGITVVVIGLCLVVYKINRERGFWWLIRAQLIALVLTVILYSLFPVDYVAHRYNVAAVARGYLHPSVMIAVKPISDEGIFPLLNLANCDDEIIRNGVLARLAERQHQLEQLPKTHWTEFQASRELLKARLKRHESAWVKYRDKPTRDQAIATFRGYAMQWY
jgi:hypothetical protein